VKIYKLARFLAKKTIQNSESIFNKKASIQALKKLTRIHIFASTKIQTIMTGIRHHILTIFFFLLILPVKAQEERASANERVDHFSTYATLITRQDSTLVFVTDEQDTLTLSLPSRQNNNTYRIGDLRPKNRFAIIIHTTNYPSCLFSYVNLTQLLGRWISTTNGNTLYFSPDRQLKGHSSVVLESYRIDPYWGYVLVKFSYFYPAEDGYFGRGDSETVLDIKELTDTKLDVVLKLSYLAYIRKNDWHMEYRRETITEHQAFMLKQYGIKLK